MTNPDTTYIPPSEDEPAPIVFIDLETSGLSAQKHAPLSIAALVLAGPHHGKTFTSTLRPLPHHEVDQRALDCNGFTRLEIQQHRCPQDVADEFKDFIDVVSPNTLVVAGGYNYKFDEAFLRAWLTTCLGASYYGNTFSSNYAEVMSYIKMVWPDWKQRFVSMKQVDQYQHHFGTPLVKAHSAEADVAATCRLFLHADKCHSQPSYTPYHEA